ncbi:MAG: FAD-binding oxidoreductase [Thermoplasmata archaeon]|nr:FAD-binding oxidoreductase [Thermoplasmata archaeon]
MPDSADVLILGAGIAGSALAYHLARRSAGSVIVAEPRTPAAGATSRAAGVVTEQLWDRWDVEVTRESHREYLELCSTTHPEAYRQNGFLRLTRNPEALEVLEAALVRLRSWGVGAELLSADRLGDLVPDGSFGDVVGALYGRGDACVTPSTLAELYVAEARKRGVRFEFGVPVEPRAHRDGRWRVDVGGAELNACTLVIAAGAWSKSLLQRVGHPLPLTPYRTQAAVLRPETARSSFPTVHDVDSDVYVRPEDQGRILAGDGTEDVEADPERFAGVGDQGFLAHLASAFETRFPGWSRSELVSAWAGVCTSTHDRHPLIGAVPDAPDLHVLTGFNGFGVMRGGGAASRLARVLSGEAEGEALLGPAWVGRVTGPVAPFPPRPGFTLEGGDHPRF